MKSELLNISSLAAQFGVTLRTLRFYEAQGLLNPSRLGASRFYSARDRVRLELILKGKRLGFTLGEIKQIIGDPLPAPLSRGAQSAFTDHLSPEQIEGHLARLESRREEVQLSIDELRSVLAKADQPPERNILHSQTIGA